MKRTCPLLCVLFAFWMTACTNKKEILRIHLDHVVLNDSLMTIMPGNMALFDEFIVWTDPFSKEYFLNLHSAVDGSLISQVVKIGQGPGEFTQPGMSSVIKNREIKISEHGKNKVSVLSVDSLLSGKNPVKDISEVEELVSNFTLLDEDFYLKNTENGDDDYFYVMDENGSYTFGCYPIEKEKYHLWGEFVYDPKNKYICFGTFDAPYMGLYKMQDKRFELVAEYREPVNYQMTEYGPHIIETRHGPRGIVFTKDYIVTIERDVKYDKTDEATVGRDFTKCPTTVFVYDYKLELQYIANLDLNIVRIAANSSSNSLYAFVINPEFAIVTCELPSI